ncbi:MAG: MBL fold metallo-hydrolase [Fusobacteriaceae bacterium]|jgi:L-ascorbate metabolism protein UlaG (beta-lactamase superfamily)|nr:MBL fold metallo-hydrolase [Fusobacteriaceae bacterium]
MKILFVNHSCFIVESESGILIFDFYKLPWQKNKEFSPEQVLDSGKKLFVFASHGHEDHYSAKIMAWDNGKRDITFILSDDITTTAEKENRLIVGENRELTAGPLQIRTFGSSDLGVSFLVRVDGKTLFHAGDLNWWHWDEETPDERKYAEDLFKGIVKQIREYVKKEKIAMDVAFFPVDGRLDYAWSWGGEYFIREFHPKIFVPMHFWKNFQLTQSFSDHMMNLQSTTRCVVLHHNIETLSV